MATVRYERDDEFVDRRRDELEEALQEWKQDFLEIVDSFVSGHSKNNPDRRRADEYIDNIIELMLECSLSYKLNRKKYRDER